MMFTPAPLPGVFTIDPALIGDSRGFFARTFCTTEFAEHGLETTFVQCNSSGNTYRNTVRGLHFQRSPHEEVKVVRCIRGAIFDVAVDLRPDSATYLQWFGVELTAENRRMLYVPRGFGHGYQTLSDNAEVLYQVSDPYTPGVEGGCRFDDPAIGVTWPLDTSDAVVSDKDAAWPLLTE